MEVSGRQPLGSDDHNTGVLCDPCLGEGEEENAEFYCTVCNEYLCDADAKAHRKTAALKTHQLLGWDSMPRQKLTSYVDDVCSIHSGEVVKYYCTVHDNCCCSVCATIEHKQCDLKYIDEIAKGYESSTEYKSVEKSLANLTELLKNTKEVLAKNKIDVQSIHAEFVSEVKKFRSEINTILDLLENTTLKDAKCIRDRDNKTIDFEDTNCGSLLADIQEMSSTIETLRKYKQERQLVIFSKKARAHVKEHESMSAELANQYAIREYKFRPNEQIRQSLQSFHSLGQLEDTGDGKKPTGNMKTTRKVKGAESLKSTPSRSVTASHVGDTKSTPSRSVTASHVGDTESTPSRSVTASHVGDTESTPSRSVTASHVGDTESTPSRSVTASHVGDTESIPSRSVTASHVGDTESTPSQSVTASHVGDTESTPSRSVTASHVGDSKSTPSRSVTASHVGNINIQHSTDISWLGCYISGGVMIDTNKLVLVDYNNSSVKVVDVNNHTVISCLKLPTKPRDITCVTQEQVVATCDSGRLIFLKVGGRVTIVKELTIGGAIGGIVYTNNTLVLVFRSPESCVKVINLNGQVLKTFKYDRVSGKLFMDPRYITVSTDQKTLFVLDCGSHCVTRLDMDGTLQHVYTDNTLRGPRGLAVDWNDNMYVAGHASHTIHQLSTECKPIQILLDSTHGIGSPRTVTYCKTGHKLYVSNTCFGSKRSEVSVFQLH